MNSKDILHALCQRGNAQCKACNVDIDIMHSLALVRTLEGYCISLVSATPNSSIVTYNSNVVCSIASFGANTYWHHEAYYKYIHAIHMFNSEVYLPDEVYDVVLQSMMQYGCTFTVDAADCDCIEADIRKLQDNFKETAKELMLTKAVNPMHRQNAMALYTNFNKACRKLTEKAHPTIALVPHKFANAEELLIWLDMNCMES